MVSESVKKVKEKGMTDLYCLRRKLYEHPVLTNLFLEVTSRCNAHCEHCGSRCDASVQGKEIETEYLKKTLIDIATHYNPADVFLNVTGGEPLLRKDFFDIMEFAVGLGYRWGMTSNGMLITKSMVKKLEKAKMSTVSISLDGLEKTHEEFRKVPHSFKKIINALKMMLASDVIKTVQVTTVANKKNIGELEDLYHLLLDIGITNWRVVNCDPIGRANDNQDIFLDNDDYKYLFHFIKEKNSEGLIKVSYGCSHYLGYQLEKEVRDDYFVCFTGICIASILSNGDIFVCPNVPRRPELIQGNIRKDNFVDVWENKFKCFRTEMRTSCADCLKCEHWKYCGGDSFHTWDFDRNKPNICLKEIFDEV